MVGMLGLLPIAWGLFNHSLTMGAAAVRAVVLLVGLMVLEAIAIPLVKPLLSPAERRTRNDEHPRS
jgi:hypothetical protein